MADTGWVIAGTGTTVVASGSTWPWDSPNSITTVTTGSYAIVTNITSSTITSDFLRATNFGFLIPNEAEIKGIEARISACSVDVAGSKDITVRVLSGGSVVGQNKATRTWPTGSFVTNDYGSSLDMWGLSLTPAQVNAANFGLNFQAEVAGKGKIQVSSIWMRIHYDEGGVFVRDSGVWKEGSAYVRDGGIWKPADKFVNDSGVWKS